MRHQIGEHITVVEGEDDVVYVTRPSLITNKMNTVPFIGVDAAFLVGWLTERYVDGGRTAMVQDAFPDMNAEEREFLMTGITAQEWRDNLSPSEDELEGQEGDVA